MVVVAVVEVEEDAWREKVICQPTRRESWAT